MQPPSATHELPSPALATGDALAPGVDEALLGAAQAPSPSYELRFEAAKTEDPLAETFLEKGGLLGAAAASGCTPFSLTHSDHSTAPFITNTPRMISIPISRALIETSQATFRDETGKDPAWKAGAEVLLLSDRTVLNVGNCRTCTAINGIPVVPHSAGRAATPLSTLFSTVDARQFTDAHAPHPDVRRVPFRQIPLKYTNWGAAAATVCAVDAHVVKLTTDAETGATTETPVDVAFFTPQKLSARLSGVQKTLKTLYDDGWATATAISGTIPNLHKNVMSTVTNAGYDGTEYLLASALLDARPSLNRKAAETILAAAVATGDTDATSHHMIEAMQKNSMDGARLYGEKMATALSAGMAASMPYKSDSHSVVATTGLATQNAENWNLDAAAKPAQMTGDCEDLSKLGSEFFQTAVKAQEELPEDVMRTQFPTLNALANFSKHYVVGVGVLSAFGGHASAQNEGGDKCGHAALLCTSKLSLSAGLTAAMHANVGARDGPGFVPRKSDKQREEDTDKVWQALFPAEFVSALPEKERFLFESAETGHRFRRNHPEACPANFCVEGTAFVKTGNALASEAKLQERLHQKHTEEAAADTLGPSVLRVQKDLGVGSPFWYHIEEFVAPMSSPLMTDRQLRAGKLASSHFRITPLPTNGEITKTGVSPKEFATGEFAIVPSWTVGTEDGDTLDLAHAEAMANTMPMAAQTQALSSAQEQNLEQNFKKIQQLQEHLQAPGKDTGIARVDLVSIVPLAALIGSPNAMTHICETVRHIPQAMGTFYGIEEDEKILGLAVSETTGKELGRFVTLELKLPQ